MFSSFKNPSIRCKCCQKKLKESDKKQSKLFRKKKFRQCDHCNGNVCFSCGLCNICHECMIKETITLDPDALMQTDRKTLLSYLNTLHCTDYEFQTLDNKYLVKQILMRYRVHDEWDPNIENSPPQLRRSKIWPEQISVTSMHEYNRSISKAAVLRSEAPRHQPSDHQQPHQQQTRSVRAPSLRNRSSPDEIDQLSFDELVHSSSVYPRDREIVKSQSTSSEKDLLKVQSISHMSKNVSLEDIRAPEEIYEMPVRDIRMLLEKYDVHIYTGAEKGHLIELVTKLWDKKQTQGTPGRRNENENTHLPISVSIYRQLNSTMDNNIKSREVTSPGTSSFTTHSLTTDKDAKLNKTGTPGRRNENENTHLPISVSIYRQLNSTMDNNIKSREVTSPGTSSFTTHSLTTDKDVKLNKTGTPGRRNENENTHLPISVSIYRQLNSTMDNNIKSREVTSPGTSSFTTHSLTTDKDAKLNKTGTPGRRNENENTHLPISVSIYRQLNSTMDNNIKSREETTQGADSAPRTYNGLNYPSPAKGFTDSKAVQPKEVDDSTEEVVQSQQPICTVQNQPRSIERAVPLKNPSGKGTRSEITVTLDAIQHEEAIDKLNTKDLKALLLSSGIQSSTINGEEKSFLLSLAKRLWTDKQKASTPSQISTTTRGFHNSKDEAVPEKHSEHSETHSESKITDDIYNVQTLSDITSEDIIKKLKPRVIKEILSKHGQKCDNIVEKDELQNNLLELWRNTTLQILLWRNTSSTINGEEKSFLLSLAKRLWTDKQKASTPSQISTTTRGFHNSKDEAVPEKHSEHSETHSESKITDDIYNVQTLSDITSEDIIKKFKPRVIKEILSKHGQKCDNIVEKDELQNNLLELWRNTTGTEQLQKIAKHATSEGASQTIHGNKNPSSSRFDQDQSEKISGEQISKDANRTTQNIPNPRNSHTIREDKLTNRQSKTTTDISNVKTLADITSFASIQALGVHEIKEILTQHRVNFSNIREKKDLEKRLLTLWQNSKRSYETRRPINVNVKQIEGIVSMEEIPQLSNRQLKESLVKNKIECQDILEREDLDTEVNTLWKEHKRKNQDDEICMICRISNINCVFIECGHFVACIECGQQINECPMCGFIVVHTVPIFRLQ